MSQKITLQNKVNKLKQCYFTLTDVSMKIYDMVKTAAERLLSSEEKLNGLDKESGDGDCGSTMARGAQGIVLLTSLSYTP